MKWFTVAGSLFLLFYLSVIATVLYVAWHFISKFW